MSFNTQKSLTTFHLAVVVVVYPLPCPLLVGGVRSSPASYSVHLASSAATPAGSVHNCMGDNVVRAVEEMCVMCVSVTQGAYGSDGCDLASPLRIYLFLSWARVWRVRRGSLFRAANVWWRCAQYFVIASCD